MRAWSRAFARLLAMRILLLKVLLSSGHDCIAVEIDLLTQPPSFESILACVPEILQLSLEFVHLSLNAIKLDLDIDDGCLIRTFALRVNRA